MENQLLCNKKRVTTCFPAETKRGCVGVWEPNAPSWARTSSASLPLRYPLTPPSVCSSQSALLPARPPPLPRRTPAHTRTHTRRQLLGRTRGRRISRDAKKTREGGKQPGRLLGEQQPLAYSPNYSYFFFHLPPINLCLQKKIKVCTPWRDLKHSQDIND